MLPAVGVYHFPWEINSESVPEGRTLRTFGSFSSKEIEKVCRKELRRINSGLILDELHSYDMVSSQATFTAQHSLVRYCIRVCTKFVEPFQAQLGSLYIVLGETEYNNGGELMLKARVITCVEGMNLQLLEKAIEEQRKYFQERDRQLAGTTS